MILQKQNLPNLIKSHLHNIVVLIFGFIIATAGILLDTIFAIGNIQSTFTVVIGLIFLAIGFYLRVWSTFLFYERQMSVIKLEPQNTLITSGPFSFSRNPLYLGGNVLIPFGAVLFLGSILGILLIISNIFLVNNMIKREEKQLEQNFGNQWFNYKHQVRRWI